uniref:CBY1 interacting BAR domain containing 2 n=1 Tax=Myripristis murdjan TaxID=586833 RepID=A0A667WV59_9TELE
MNSLFSRDAQVKTMEQTVNHAEKHLGRFCSLLASYTRKTAKLRDKGDLLVAQLFDFSSTEDPALRVGLKNLAEDLAMVQDYRQAQVRARAPGAHGMTTVQADLKKFNADRNREMKELQKLGKIRLKNPADRQSIAEVNAQKASNNAQRSTRQLEETINDFQRQKRVFTDFITVEMLFHAKALEIYTHTFQNLEREVSPSPTHTHTHKHTHTHTHTQTHSDTQPPPPPPPPPSIHSHDYISIAVWIIFHFSTLCDLIFMVDTMKSPSCPLNILPTPLVSIINTPLKSGQVPSYFKYAILQPLLKKPNLDPPLTKHYTSISKLPY